VVFGSCGKAVSNRKQKVAGPLVWMQVRGENTPWRAATGSFFQSLGRKYLEARNVPGDKFF
jgi:hypothetical protein